MTDHIGKGLAIFAGISIFGTFVLFLHGVASERAYRNVNRLQVHDGQQWVFKEDQR